MDMSLSELQELVMDREAWFAVVHGFIVSSKGTKEECHQLQLTSGFSQFLKLCFPFSFALLTSNPKGADD